MCEKCHIWSMAHFCRENCNEEKIVEISFEGLMRGVMGGSRKHLTLNFFDEKHTYLLEPLEKTLNTEWLITLNT